MDHSYLLAAEPAAANWCIVAVASLSLLFSFMQQLLLLCSAALFSNLCGSNPLAILHRCVLLPYLLLLMFVICNLLSHISRTRPRASLPFAIAVALLVSVSGKSHLICGESGKLGFGWGEGCCVSSNVAYVMSGQLMSLNKCDKAGKAECSKVRFNAYTAMVEARCAVMYVRESTARPSPRPIQTPEYHASDQFVLVVKLS
jgi:hypothetical protein